MRLWHYQLIPVLPKQMLVSQWRECIAIKRQWEKGALKHRLVSYVIDYQKSAFYYYAQSIAAEMTKRNIKYQRIFLDELYDFCFTGGNAKFNYPEHNNRYLQQCYYNLQEKYDRRIISDEEWKKIDNYINKLEIINNHFKNITEEELNKNLEECGINEIL